MLVGRGLEACGGKGLGWGWRYDVATTCSLQTHPHTLQGTPLNFGLNYRAPIHFIFFFLRSPMGSDNGPREAWAHMGWVGHPAH